ncbi:MAG: hypothetical protein PHQ40_04110, partial [Anaerolineaceae bacterium]|nr:hypothetical protein [Anaerolineaceae bacterium]
MEPVLPQYAHSTTLPNQRSGCADQVVLFVTVVFLLGFTILSQSSAWAADEVVFEGLLRPPFFSRALIALGFGGVISLPPVLLTLFWRTSRYSLFYRTWAFAAGFSILMSGARLLPITAVQASTTIQLGLMVFYCLMVVFWMRRSGSSLTHLKAPRSQVGLWLSIALAVIIGLPWIAWGALGSPLDTLLSLLEGILFGATASVILYYCLFQPLRLQPVPNRHELFMAGFATLLGLGLMTFGLQINGFETYLFLAIPGLAILCFVLNMFTASGWLSSSILIGLGAAFPLMFVDPDELSMIISSGQGELLQWVNQ